MTFLFLPKAEDRAQKQEEAAFREEEIEKQIAEGEESDSEYSDDESDDGENDDGDDDDEYEEDQDDNFKDELQVTSMGGHFVRKFIIN